jgi:hypothetical protein
MDASGLKQLPLQHQLPLQQQLLLPLQQQLLLPLQQQQLLQQLPLLTPAPQRQWQM